ncbi:MAG: carboxypeptidase-like regulatory domain-containing protein [Nannocystaceae bacterium]|nr:carboxypeptidase-like regulatory domain-containing protein [Nannocystaceae bacterium]
MFTDTTRYGASVVRKGNNMKITKRFASLSLAAFILAPGCDEGVDNERTDAEAQEAQEENGVTKLSGQLLDTDGSPIAHAEVSVAVGSVEVTARTMTTADGLYAIDVPLAVVHEALANSQEVAVLFRTPTSDLEPYGTVEGDYVHLLPASLDEFINLDELGADELEMRVAYVPRQGHGFTITDELIENGGVLTWAPEGTQYGEDFSVSLVIEPGSLHKGQDRQNEITLTVIEQALAPMQIPADGFGPLWTIQPRDITFDPPARIRIQGNRLPVLGPSDMEVGQETDLYGASLETGWKYFGGIEMVEDNDGIVTLESTQGIISHGAWGHVFGASGSDWGFLAECFSYPEAGEAPFTTRTPCAIIDDNRNSCDDPTTHTGVLKCEQIDYNGASHRVYSTVTEPKCNGCGGANAPYVLAMGADDIGAGDLAAVNLRVKAVGLCPEETNMTDMDALYASIRARSGLGASNLTFLYDVTDDSVDADLNWRNFSKQAKIQVRPPVGCAE